MKKIMSFGEMLKRTGNTILAPFQNKIKNKNNDNSEGNTTDKGVDILFEPAYGTEGTSMGKSVQKTKFTGKRQTRKIKNK